MPKRERILVIRLGALGDLVLCFQAFHEIRAAHPEAEIALLTMPAFADFAKAMPWFDTVLVDSRAPLSQPFAWLKLISQIKNFAPSRVYDLQGKFRQSVLYALLGGPFGPEWSGAAPLSSHPRLWPPQPGMHYTDFAAAQLRSADVPPQPPADLSWLDALLTKFASQLVQHPRYALLIPGCAPGRDYKRWPADRYAGLAQLLVAQDIASFAIGTQSDAAVIDEITLRAPGVVNLCGQTSLQELAALARRSVCVIGNDTGPTHLAAAVGAKTLALISGRVNAVWSAPKGPFVAVLQAEPLADVPADKVLLALQDTLVING
jgi:ADP-heptose:LPS heptosyltransferase